MTTPRLTAAVAAFATTLFVFHAVASIALPPAPAAAPLQMAAVTSTVNR